MSGGYDERYVLYECFDPNDKLRSRFDIDVDFPSYAVFSVALPADKSVEERLLLDAQTFRENP